MYISNSINWVIALTGVYEYAAPYINGYQTNFRADYNAALVGLAIMWLGIFAGIAVGKRSERILDGLVILLGIWLIISPFVLGFASMANRAALWNPIAVGGFVIVLELIAAFTARKPLTPSNKASLPNTQSRHSA